MKLTDQQISLLKLIKRSKPIENGWCRVSKQLWPYVQGKLPADLVDLKASEDNEFGFIKLTLRGQAVADYI